MEIETQMAADKEREAQRLAKVGESRKPLTAVRKPATAFVRRTGTNGMVKRPLTPRVGRGF